jgi:hypothetical protein
VHPRQTEFVDNNIMHPERDWSLGVILGLGVCFFGIWLSFDLYNQYKDISIEDLNGIQGSVVYRSSLVEEVLVNFSERNKVYDDIISKSKSTTFIMVPVEGVEIVDEILSTTTDEIVVEEVFVESDLSEEF